MGIRQFHDGLASDGGIGVDSVGQIIERKQHRVNDVVDAGPVIFRIISVKIDQYFWRVMCLQLLAVLPPVSSSSPHLCPAANDGFESTQTERRNIKLGMALFRWRNS